MANTTLGSPETAASDRIMLPSSVDDLTLPDLSQLADFRVYTAAVTPADAAARDYRFNAKGSSNVRDMDGDTIEVSGLQAMCKAQSGMAIFVNHSYNVPEDVVGFLASTPRLGMQDEIADLYIDTQLISDVNPRAKQLGNQIYAGVRQGVSVGCMPTAIQFWDEKGKVVREPDFWDVLEGKLSLHVLDLVVLEWSYVGLPANPRCWVQDAAQGLFARSLRDGTPDRRLAAIVRGFSDKTYRDLIANASVEMRKDLDTVSPRKRRDPRNLLWDASKQSFAMTQAGVRGVQMLTRGAAVALLTDGVAIEPDKTDATLAKCSCSGETGAMDCECGPNCGCRMQGGTCPPMTKSNTTVVDKAATDAEKAAQEARSKRYHIGIKEGGNVTKPGEWSSVPDSEWGDPVNYAYPMPDKSHADNAASRWGDASNRGRYNSSEQKIIGDRIERRQRHFGESSDEKSLGDQTPMMRKAGDGNDYPDASDVAVSSDGSHVPAVGNHTHVHKAYGSQGNDATHSHDHPHDGDAIHDHHSAEKHTHPHLTKAGAVGDLIACANCQKAAPDGHTSMRCAFCANCMNCGFDVDSVNAAAPSCMNCGAAPMTRVSTTPPPPGSQGGLATNRAQTDDTISQGTSGFNIADTQDSAASVGQPGQQVGGLPQSPAQAAKSIDPHLLAIYNSLGAQLGFAEVDATGKSLHTIKSISPEAEVALRSGLTAMDAILDGLMQQCGVPDDDSAANGTGSSDGGEETTLPPGTFNPNPWLGFSLNTLASAMHGLVLSKAGARHSAADMGALQSIHDSVVQLTGGSVCPGLGRESLEPPVHDGPASGATNNGDMQSARGDFTGLTPATSVIPVGASPIKAVEAMSLLTKTMNDLTDKLDSMGVPALVKTADGLRLSYAQLTSDKDMIADALERYAGVNLGRPTQMKRSIETPAVPAVQPVGLYDPNALPEAASIPLTDLYKQTEVKYIQGVGDCRYWPDGVGKGQRPELRQQQVVNMAAIDGYFRSLGAETDQYRAYIEGRACYVPKIMPAD